MLYAVLGAVLFIMPFVIFPIADGIRYPKEIMSVISIALIIASSVQYRARGFRFGSLFLFLAWCFATLIFCNRPIPVFLQGGVIAMPYEMIAWKELLYITLAAITIYLTASSEQDSFIKDFGFIKVELRQDDGYRFIFDCVSLCVAISCVYALVQAMGFDELFRAADPNTGWVAHNPLTFDENTGDMTRRVVATVGNPSILGIWLAMCLPVCLHNRNKVGVIAFVLSLAVIAITFSATAIVGACVSISGYLLFTSKKLLLVFLSLIVAVSVFAAYKAPNKVKTFINPTGRIAVLKESWNILKEKPLTGMGLGTFEYLVGNNPNIVNKLSNENWKEMHNDIGQIWWAAGFVGLAIFLFFVGSAFFAFFRNVTTEGAALFGSLLAFLVMSLTYFNFRIAPISVYGLVFTGLFLRTIGDRK